MWKGEGIHSPVHRPAVKMSYADRRQKGHVGDAGVGGNAVETEVGMREAGRENGIGEGRRGRGRQRN